MTLDIRFRNCSKSEALEAEIQTRAEKLQKLFPRATSCQVIVEAPHHSHQKGNHYRVLVSLKVPGKELVAGDHVDKKPESENPYLAVHQSFDALKRQLQSYVRGLRGDGKRYSLPDFERVAS